MGRGGEDSSQILFGAATRRRQRSAAKRRRDWAAANVTDYLRLLAEAQEEALTDALRMQAIDAAAQLQGLDDFRLDLHDLFIDAKEQALGIYYEVYEVPNDAGEEFYYGEEFYDGYHAYLTAEELLDERWLEKVAEKIDERI